MSLFALIIASLSRCVETPGAAFSAIVPGMRIKSRQDRLEPDNLSYKNS